MSTVQGFCFRSFLGRVCGGRIQGDHDPRSPRQRWVQASISITEDNRDGPDVVWLCTQGPLGSRTRENSRKRITAKSTHPIRSQSHRREWQICCTVVLSNKKVGKSPMIRMEGFLSPRSRASRGGVYFGRVMCGTRCMDDR
jgi:hypothetical protein